MAHKVKDHKFRPDVFNEIDPDEIRNNPFTLIKLDYFLLTGGSPESYNTMTANWGGFGYLWDKNVSYCFVRPDRYTNSFMENTDHYTFSFFGDKLRHVLDFCGEHSGKDVNKAERLGITPVNGPHNTVYFAEARMVIVSRKLYVQELSPNNFTDQDIVKDNYAGDLEPHRMYIGEVVNCFTR